MAYDNEHRLVSKVITDKNINTVIERGVKDDWIIDDDLRRVWKFIREHNIKYQEVPSSAAVKDNFPNFKIINVEDSLDYLLDKMVEYTRNRITRNGVQDVVKLMTDNDHESALVEMSKVVSTVNEQGVIGTTHIDITKDPDAFFVEYEQRQNSVLLGVPTGFKVIDDATAGLQGGQLITLIAPPKTGKSQIALRIAANVHEAGLVPMFQSFEMNNHEQTQRFMSMGANLSAQRLRLGTLKGTEEDRLLEFIDKLKERKPFHFVDAVNGLTIDALVAKADQLKPDILFIDGVYLMIDQQTGDANTPQAITNITRGLKRVAQRLNIPVVITTQTLLWKMKGGKVTADSIGYSSSFFQDSDVILGLEPIEEDDQLRVLKIVQSRNCQPTETQITWRWDLGCFHDDSERNSCKYCTPWSV
jgi:hypothetical protein